MKFPHGSASLQKSRKRVGIDLSADIHYSTTTVSERMDIQNLESGIRELPANLTCPEILCFQFQAQEEHDITIEV